MFLLYFYLNKPTGVRIRIITRTTSSLLNKELGFYLNTFD